MDAERTIRANLWQQKKLLAPLDRNMPLRNAFEWLLKFLMWYTGVSVPLMAAFRISYDPGQLVVDYLVDAIFWVDIIMTLRTTYYDANQEFVTDAKMIRDAYIYSRMPFDIIANIPWELFAVAAGYGHDTNVFASWRLFRMFRFCRIKKVHKPVLVEYNNSGARQLVLYFPLMTHWTACIWWSIGESAYLDGHVRRRDHDGGSAWLVRTPGSAPTNTASERLGVLSSQGQDYISSLYWASTTLMKAAWVHPSTLSEKCFASFIVLLGAVMFAVILGQINGIIRKIDEATVQRRTKLATFHQFCNQNGIGPVLTKKVISYAMAEWNLTGGVSKQGAFDGGKLSPLLRSQLIYEMYKDLLQASALLNRVSQGCAKALLMKSSQQVCLKNELLIGYGQMARELFIIMTGSLQLSVPANVRKASTAGAENSRKSMSKKPVMQFRILDRPGAITGCWKPFDNATAYPYEAMAKEFCTMLNISRPALVDVMSNFSSYDRQEIVELLEDEHQVTMSALRVGKRTQPSSRASKASQRFSEELSETPAPEESAGPTEKATITKVRDAYYQLSDTISDIGRDIIEIKQKTSLLPEMVDLLSGNTTARSGGEDSARILTERTTSEDVKGIAQARAKEREDIMAKKKREAMETADEKQQITKGTGSGQDQGLTAAMVL